MVLESRHNLARELLKNKGQLSCFHRPRIKRHIWNYWVHFLGLLLLRHNLVLDLLVRRPGQDLFLHQFILTTVGPSFDDLL